MNFVIRRFCSCEVKFLQSAKFRRRAGKMQRKMWWKKAPTPADVALSFGSFVSSLKQGKCVLCICDSWCRKTAMLIAHARLFISSGLGVCKSVLTIFVLCTKF